MITAYFHPGYAAPIGETHAMPIRKFGLVAEAVRGLGGVRLETPGPVHETDLARVHTPAYIEAIRSGEPRALAESQKFPWSPELFPSVCLTSGGCLAAARRALDHGVAAALVSGFHHACGDHGEGFCTFNGLVVTLDRLRVEGRIRRAAVLDMDLHYGNGTASLMVDRPDFLALSIYGNDYANNIPYRDVRTRRHVDGINHVSFALPENCDGATQQSVMAEALPLLLKNGRPDLLLYQAGADPYHEDPYSPLKLDHDDLGERDRAVFAFARAQGIPIAWVLAGGYTRDIRKIVEVHVRTFHAALDIYGSRP
jgi:acetoin utilization deacetylase AcuC-like enzyme